MHAIRGPVLSIARGLFVAALAAGALPGMATPLLSAPFGEHMVLQRGQPIALWGHAAPRAQVTLQLAGHTLQVRADRLGTWTATLPALAAGGPHVLVARSGADTQRLDDVLVGDVWLCSGQSNMELPVHRTLDARAELASAAHPHIRLLKIPKRAHTVPATGFDDAPAWQAATPESVRDFSAACYYFARELRRDVDVPMGLIDASWGGSKIQAWTSAATLRRQRDAAVALDVLDAHARDPGDAAARWGRLWQTWWSQHATDAPWQADGGDGWVAAAPDQRWLAPALATHVGMAWYRTGFKLDAAQAAQGAMLELGAVDEIDTTWINARAVGSGDDPGAPRRYRLAPGTLQAGRNTLVVNVFNSYRAGGIGGPVDAQALRFDDGSRVILDDMWQVREVAATFAAPPSAPWLATSGLATLHAGMIAPLGRYGLRGALWYQGESDVGEADRYRTRLAAYRDDLRAQFGHALPLLVVQLANYGTPPTAPGESAWAQLREAQRAAVADDARSALASTIDIGERDDIHPANKQALGRRLARAARHLVYGERLPASGPVARAAWHDGDTVRVAFDDIEQGLAAYAADGPIGLELCGDAIASCRYASARIDGDSVVLRAADAAGATRVRHGWADSPVITLHDRNGLPAAPFELPIQHQEPASR